MIQMQPVQSPFRRRAWWLASIAIGLLVVLSGFFWVRTRALSYEFHSTVLEPPKAAPEIAGTNWDGTPFRVSNLQGDVILLFFGYTSCPDVCPTTLAEMMRLQTLLGAQAAAVQVVFITVDPERDTVDRLAQYVPAFDPGFYGVRLEPEALETVKQGYGIYAQKAEGNSTADGYLIDHTAATLVLDRSGRWRLLFPFGTTADTMLPDIRYLLRE